MQSGEISHAEILGEHTEDKMCGNIFVSVCLSAVSCLGCCRTTLGGESSGQLGKGSPPGVDPFPPHSDLIELPFEVPRSLFGTRGGTTTSSPGMQVVSPSTQHIPTTVILCEPSSATAEWLPGVLSGPGAGAEHRRRCGELARDGSHSRRP